MINKIEIQNFKSIVNLKLDLGLFNIIIGENGCGKTNILESFVFAAAASQGKLDNEFLLNRGIRLPGPQFIKPAFQDISTVKNIQISISEGLSTNDTKVQFDKENKKWEDVTISNIDRKISDVINSAFEKSKLEDKINENIASSKINKEALAKLISESLNEVIFNIVSKGDKKSEDVQKFLARLSPKKSLPTFLIYTPNELILREQNSESAIKPLGIHGEGLFAFLKEQAKSEKELFSKINKGLHLLDWFDGLEIPKTLLSNEAKLKIGDRYLKESIHFFDQRSTNEGFLYLLFYLTLFNSKETPSFFAIDNIETSFNPKLCTQLSRYLIQMAKENGKQVILTTHNPYILDALDLSDEEQRLFVARRDIDGHTKVSRIQHKENRKQKLSEIWMSGFIGGLPDNF